MGSRARGKKWNHAVKEDSEGSEEDSFEYAGRGSLVVEKLGKRVEKSLHVEEDEDEEDSVEEGGGSAFGNIKVDEYKPAGKGLSKRVEFDSPSDFPPSDKSEDEDEDEEDELLQPNVNCTLEFPESEEDELVYVCEIYLPDPSTLVPAVKGSREKQGSAPKERRVSWSAEVYDPIHKEVAYATKSKQKKQPKTEKRTGKEKSKGNKASSGKDRKQDKKQLRKKAGSSRRGHKDADDW